MTQKFLKIMLPPLLIDHDNFKCGFCQKASLLNWIGVNQQFLKYQLLDCYNQMRIFMQKLVFCSESG